MRTITQILENTKYKNTQWELFLTECMMDYCYFAEHVLGFEIADYHKEWCELAEKYNRLGIEAFRGSGKTNWFAGYYVWKAIFSEGKNFLITSLNLELSKLVLKIIRVMIEDNEYLTAFVPESKKESWKATELTLRTKATFYCKTYGEGIRGLRIDYCLCDEVGSYEDKSIYWQVVSPVVQLNMGRIIAIGTPKSMIDLLSELKENDEYYFDSYPAEKQGKPLWPQKYTTRKEDMIGKRSLYLVRRELGELSYQQEFLLIPISSANSLFPVELTSKALTNDCFMPFGKAHNQYFIGYDIAISPKGDYTVMTVLQVNNDGKKLVYAERFRDTFPAQKEMLRKLVDMFRPVKIVIDATGLGDQQAHELESEISGVIPLKITYEEKYKMLLDLRTEFERFNISLPNNKDDPAYAFTQQLVAELTEFNLKIDLRAGQTTRPKFHSGKYDDCVLSLALANKASEQLYGEVSFKGFDD